MNSVLHGFEVGCADKGRINRFVLVCLITTAHLSIFLNLNDRFIQ